MPTLATNRQAYRDYKILEELEAGIVLTGAEVKSAKNKHLQLKGSFIKISARREAILYNCHISAYHPASNPDYVANCEHKLLLREEEIISLQSESRGRNLTVVPLRMYTTPRGLVKVLIGLAQGKKKYEKRRTKQEREIQREIARTLKKYR